MIRPATHLKNITKEFPGCWKTAEYFRQSRGKDLHWPDWCFLPLAASYAIISGGGANRVPAHKIRFVGIMGALAAWRFTQGIYRFDSEIFESITQTELTGDIPVDALKRLPEWCVYIETPGMTAFDLPLHGFFAHLESDSNTDREELRLLLDTEEELIPVPLHVDKGQNLLAAIRTAVDESARQAKAMGEELPEMDLGKLKQMYAPLVSLLLYLCSDQPDISSAGRFPLKPKPKKTKKGPRLFPPNHPTIWETGFKLGSALRTATETQHSQSGNRAPIKPHIRRGHWHSYWTGSKLNPDTRKLILKWLPPMPVGIKQDITPTVRKVK